MNIITNYIQYSHVDIHQDHKILIDFFPACGPSHTASDHQENGSEHEGADPQGFWVEAFDHQGAQRGGVAQDDDQGHGSSLQGKDGGQEHSWYPKKNIGWPFPNSLVSFVPFDIFLSCQVLHVDNHHFIFRDSMPQCLLGLILMHETNTQLVAKMSWVFLPHFTLCFASPRYHNRMAPPCTNGTDHARSQRGCREKRRGSNMRRQKIAVPKPSSTPYSGWRNATLENLLSSTPFLFLPCFPLPLRCDCLSCRRTTCWYSLIYI